MSIVVSAIFGYILALGVTFAIQDIAKTTGAGTFAVKQVYLDALGTQDGRGDALHHLMAQFYCGMSSITSASRMMYAFSRDGATPGHRLWRRLNRQRVPVYSAGSDRRARVPARVPRVLLGDGTGYVAYVAVTSIATIGALHRLRDPDLPAAARG